jgi:hypothetical protein
MIVFIHTFIFGFPLDNVYLIHFKQEHTVDYKERTFFTSLDFSKLIALHLFLLEIRISLYQTAVAISNFSLILLTILHITLGDLQLDAQNFCLFTYNTFIKILYMFRALPHSSSGGLRCNCIDAASGIVTLCR